MSEPKAIAIEQLQQAATNQKQNLNGVDGLFHRLARAIPENQELLCLKPDMAAREAIQLMGQHFYSQAPVMTGSKVLGVFSFRSFAQQAADCSLEDLKNLKHAPGDLTVGECMEQLDFADLSDEIHKQFDALERDNGVLVGIPNKLQAILTPMDVLRYYYKVASPFVFLSEIELSLRTLIRSAATEAEIKALADKVTKRQLGSDAKSPETLEQMTFDNYRLIVTSNDTWLKFQRAFGGSRERANAKLKDVGEIRNTIFHFKRPIEDEEFEKIRQVRDWLLARVEVLAADSKEE